MAKPTKISKRKKAKIKRQIPCPRKTIVTIRTNPLDIMAAEYIALFGDALRAAKKAKKKEATK